MAGRMVVGSAALADLVRPASAPDPVGGHRVLPVVPELTGLLPNRGLRRGSTIAVAAGQPRRSGGTSLMLALLAEASRAGSWCAVVGVPTFGAGAAAELGIALDRLEAGGFANSRAAEDWNRHQITGSIRHGRSGSPAPRHRASWLRTLGDSEVDGHG
ncbi:hypothetical protein LUPAC06_00157 [Micromonospora saelicesensis]|nr:hypothetical protein LUPAC06_00157 [Micromonospora saelicesensis]